MRQLIRHFIREERLSKALIFFSQDKKTEAESCSDVNELTGRDSLLEEVGEGPIRSGAGGSRCVLAAGPAQSVSRA